MRRAFSLLGIVAVCHCGDGDLDVTLVVPSPVAVGASVPVSGKDACGPSGANDCTGQKVLVDQVRVDDATMFSVNRNDNATQSQTVSITALRAGETKVHARIDNGQRIEFARADVRAAVPDRITLAPPTSCQVPVLVGTNASFDVKSKRFAGTTELLGTGGAFPLTADIADPNPIDGASFRARNTRGTGVVRSLLDPAKIDVEVFEPSQVTSMSLTLLTAPTAGSPLLSVRSALLVDTKAPCAEVFKRTVTTGTPDVCEPTAPSTISSWINLNVKKSGACAVQVTLDGTAITASNTFDVVVSGAPPSALDAGTDAGGDAAADASADSGS